MQLQGQYGTCRLVGIQTIVRGP